MEKKIHQWTEQEAYERLAAQCAQAELCQWDAERKMRRWNLSSEAMERIIAKLVKERFIDEGRFSLAFAQDKFRYNHWGKVRIEQELKLRHVARQHISQALEVIESEESESALREMIHKKRPSVKGKNEHEIRAQLIRFALGKGFRMDEIVKVVGSMDDNEEMEDEQW